MKGQPPGVQAKPRRGDISRQVVAFFMTSPLSCIVIMRSRIRPRRLAVSPPRRVTIYVVADDRVAEVGRVDAQLIRPPGYRLKLEKRRLLAQIIGYVAAERLKSQVKSNRV